MYTPALALMSRQINQPINQVKLTNVAVVRYNYTGQRFEIACYKNKILDYRAGLEADLDEVLQSPRIFTNVSKGQFAKSKDLRKAFGTDDEEAIARIILEKGNSLQVSNLERQHQLEASLSQIATWVAEHCIHPSTGRRYTSAVIKSALAAFSVPVQKPFKVQCLQAVKFLQQGPLEIGRAPMELAIEYAVDQQAKVEQALEPMTLRRVSESSNSDGPRRLVVHVDPAVYRTLDQLAADIGGRLEILQQVVMADGDSTEQAAIFTAPAPANKEDDDDSSVEDLLHKLQAVKALAGDEDSEDETPLSRQNQRKAQKKNKKAQRREEQKQHGDADDEEAPPVVAAPAAPAEPGQKSCNTCGGSFSAAEYRAHFRSDWHRFNQKLKLKGLPAVSEEEFRLCDAEEFFGSNQD